MTESTRREFLTLGAGALAGATLLGTASAQTPATGPNQTRPAGQRGMMADLSHEDILRTIVPGAQESGKWVLPPLPYDYAALEPAIDAKTMQLHHDKHHQGYVNGLIKAEEKLAEMRQSGNYETVDYWISKASFNGGGHFLHCVFWESMGPGGPGQPTGTLAEHLRRDFGGFEQFKSYFSAVAKSVEGSGWGILAYQLAGGKLVVIQAQNHNLLSQWGLVPLLCIDMWEHAYYLNYQNNRGAYIESWWNVVDWEKIGRRHSLFHGDTSALMRGRQQMGQRRQQQSNGNEVEVQVQPQQSNNE